MKRPSIRRLASILLPALLLAAGCSSKTPRQKVLEERAAWQIDLLSWAEGAEGLTLSARLSGPVHAELDTLTFKVEMRDGGGEVVDSAWYSADVSGVERGGPQDFLIRLPASDAGSIEQLSIDPVLAPTDAEAAQIPELQGL